MSLPQSPTQSPSPSAVDRLVQHESTRRQLLTMAAVGGVGAGAALLAVPGAAQAAQEKGAAPGSGRGPAAYRLTVLGTTDTHGNVLNWDYF